MTLVAVRAIYRGRVQGVGFRATAKYLAEDLGLHGYVCNIDGGRVELFAQGEKASLDRLIERLKSEFNAEADVSSVPPDPELHTFSIHR